jgi:hypothetical protein
MQRSLRRTAFPACLVSACALTCSATQDIAGSFASSGGARGTGGAPATTTTSSTTTSGAGGGLLTVGSGGGTTCGVSCSADLHFIVDCHGTVVQKCEGLEGCDPTTGQCGNACAAAEANKLAVGCEYYATFMDTLDVDSCFAAFVANTWDVPAHLDVTYDGVSLPVETFGYLPLSKGQAIVYEPLDAAAGLPPNSVAILFLSGPVGQPGFNNPVCPKATAVPSGVLVYHKTGVGKSFQITSDVPVVAYQMNPYGGGSAGFTGASLLLPTSVWDTNYVAVNAAPDVSYPNPSLNIVAMQDATKVTMVPVADASGGNGVPAAGSGKLMTFTLDKGEHAQITQFVELTGSVIQADKPVGFMAGQVCMQYPPTVPYCDHGEQMVPPVQALGSEYVGVMYRPRVPEETGTGWRIVGAAAGTQLTWTPNVGGPTTLELGEAVTFTTGTPFVVKSQDNKHPFMLFTYMSGSGNFLTNPGTGDPDFVVSVPPEQYLTHYVFFADPTYPETNLVVVRAKGTDQTFHDVTLDCLGPLAGWTPVGDYEWTRTDLSKGDFENVGNCTTGRRVMQSNAPFGLWVWGWGSPQTTIFTEAVSYGYPAGMSVHPINPVVIVPVAK